MILSPVDPVLLSVGPFTVYWYGLIVTSALFLGLSLSERALSRAGFADRLYSLVLGSSVVGGIIGARLYHVFVLNWDWYSWHLDSIVKIWEGGIAIHGALLGGVLAAFITWFFTRFSYLKFLDAVSPPLLLSQAIGRWGNFFNQEAFGSQTDLPWGIYINHMGDTYHPTFFYESVLNFIGAGLLFWISWRIVHRVSSGSVFRRDGVICMLYLGLYGLNRLLVEPLRMDSSYVYGVKIAWLVALVSLVVSCLYFTRLFLLSFKK